MRRTAKEHALTYLSRNSHLSQHVQQEMNNARVQENGGDESTQTDEVDIHGARKERTGRFDLASYYGTRQIRKFLLGCKPV